MTKSNTIHYVVCLLLTFMTIGAATATASEVTGVLSSEAAVKEAPSGDLSGTVVTDNSGTLSGTVEDAAGEGSLSGTVIGGGSNGTLTGTVQGASTSGGGSGGSSGTRTGGGGSTPSTPPGTVLGTTIDTPTAPLFPNAGVAPAATTSVPTLWSRLAAFFGNLIS